MKKVILCLLLILLSMSLYGQGHLFGQSSIYYSWREFGPFHEERMLVLHNNSEQTYTAVYCYEGTTMSIGGLWKEHGDTLVLSPRGYLCHHASSEKWEIVPYDNSKSDLDLKPLYLIKQKTGELKQLPWKDEDSIAYELHRLWDGLKPVIGTRFFDDLDLHGEE